jgi:hypothetical protein
MVVGKILGLASALGGRARKTVAERRGYWAPHSLKIDVTVPANAPTDQGITATFVYDEKIGSVKEYQLTANESWILNDIYVTAAQPVDGTLVIKKNGVEIARVRNINSLLVSNPSRPKPLAIRPIRFNPNERVSFEFIPATSPGTAQNVSVIIEGLKWVIPPTP